MPHRGEDLDVRCYGLEEEVFMTLTILDPRSGRTVILLVEDRPAIRQPVPAQISTHPRFMTRGKERGNRRANRPSDVEADYN
jgi:hypothetical protein